MNNVVVRSLSGIVYVALIVASIFIGTWAFMVLTSVFTAVGVYEFFVMSHTPDNDKKKYALVGLVDMLFAVVLCLSSGAPFYYAMVAIMILALYFLVRGTMALTDTQPHAYREVAKSMLGVMYVGLPMFLLNVLYASVGPETHQLVLIMFIMIWLNDTGAFCFGSTLGKRRLCERLSPKKSWEGFWGGLGCCVAFGALCYWQFNAIGYPLWLWLVYGALVSVFATWGDLFESMLKRTVHVKDSGNIIPGHGGILDRIDSLLFVAPMTMIVFMLSLF